MNSVNYLRIIFLCGSHEPSNPHSVQHKATGTLPQRSCSSWQHHHSLDFIYKTQSLQKVQMNKGEIFTPSLIIYR